MRAAIVALLLGATLAHADESLPLETLFRGNMVLPWAKELRTYELKSLPQLGESGLWSQLPVGVRQELSRSQEGMSLSRLVAVSSPERTVEIVSLRKAADGSMVVRYALGVPQAGDDPVNVHVLRIPKWGDVRFELAAPGAGLAQAVQAAPQPLQVCHRFDCTGRVEVTLPEAVWTRVQALFPTPSVDAAEERARVARAIGVLEAEVGARAGTDEDKGGWSGNAQGADPGQQDCLDESANTATYLGLLTRRGLLRFHRPEETKRRGFFATHFSASMRDLASGRLYVVDSWFRDNGEPAVIQTLKAWKKKTKPAPSPGPVVVDSPLGN